MTEHGAYSYGDLTVTPAVLISTTWIFVSLRCWVKSRLVHSFGLDDWLLLVALVRIFVISKVLLIDMCALRLDLRHYVPSS